MLFILAVDVFQRMISAANSIFQRPLSNRISKSMVALQYADDTALVVKADISTLITFKLIVRLFTSISGLEVNFSKSTFIPLNISAQDLPLTGAVVGFSRTDFPIMYLGMPLTLKRPTRELYTPIIERI